tara:strand:- start:374 stop:571 length:198 start_codon:yes stop_codon:yes gene_type:complete
MTFKEMILNLQRRIEELEQDNLELFERVIDLEDELYADDELDEIENETFEVSELKQVDLSVYQDN